MNKTILLSLALFFAATGSQLWAQPLEDWIEAAESSFEKGDFYSAYRYYDVALKYDTSRMDLWYKLGESAQFFTAYAVAENAYRRVATSAVADTFPLLQYRQGEVLQKQGRYLDAVAVYDSFLTLQPEISDSIASAAERNLINCEWASDVVGRMADTEINHLGNGINSRFSDFGFYRRDDTLYFSTMRFVFKKDSIRPKRQLIKILRGLPGEQISPLPKNINRNNGLAAHTAYNETGDRVFYTICEYTGLSSEVRCDLYSSRIGRNGKWEDPLKLAINDPNATNTHPNVGVDPGTADEYLYFASDRAGGRGGLDIYRARLNDDGSVGTPEAVSALNSAGNDATPFYYADRRVMYFSTDGRLTMGGYDVYRASWGERGWGRPVNMGIPVNSSYNDLYYSRYGEEEKAYFASNRPDSLAIFWDDRTDACCNDIYAIGITDEIKLLALTFNELDESELEGATLYLYEKGPDGRRLVDSLTNPIGNDFNFILEPGKQYELEAVKPGFSTDMVELDLTDPELMYENEIVRKLYLSPGIKLDVLTFDGIDSTDLVGATVLLYEITEDGRQILVDSIVNPLDNDYEFTIQRGKQYQVFARKDGYTPASAVVDTKDPALANVDRIERKLYLNPGLNLEVYTFRSLDSMPLTGARVYLYEFSPQGDILVDSISNAYGNQFAFPVKAGKQYVIRGERDGYGPAEAFVDLRGPDVPQTGTIRRDLYLGQLLEIFTYDAETEEELPGVELRLLDAKTGEVIAERINPDGNYFPFSVDLDREYVVEATRKGYEDFSEVLRFTQDDLVRMGGKLTFDLYLQPIDDPGALLPLILYYDNDHPNPRTYQITTDLEYMETNIAYYQKKQEFIENFIQDMDTEEAFQTRRRFDDFFDREVRGGRYDLELFAQKLLAFLQSGNTFQLDLRGFASPRASTNYNNILSARRIDAVINYFERYEDGALRPYMTSGALTFETLPLGETQADPRVIDKLNDPRNSIYNIFASLERRVEVRSSNEDDY